MYIHDSQRTIAPPAYRVDLSVVAPVYNELDNLELLHKEIVAVLGPLGLAYEVIYVNDGSQDGSGAKLVEMSQHYPNLILVDLRRNFGQTAAITAGIDHAAGSILVLIDADLQNDPADIPRLIDKLDEGYDVVSGIRNQRKDPLITRRIPSRLANALISWVTGVHLHDYGCTLKAYRREVIDEIKLYGEMHRFIPAFAAVAGASICELPVNHRPRQHGKSKYGLSRTLKVLLDLATVKFLMSYRTTPMHLFGGVGLLMIAISFITIIGAFINKWVYHISLIQTPLPQLAATFLALGIESILLGLTAEVLVRTYHESQAKTTYIVRRVVRHAPEEARS